MAGGPQHQGQQPNNYPYNQAPNGYAQPNPQQPYGQPGYSAPHPGYAPFPGKPHRATVVLVLAILSWAVCFICGIVALVMARNDMKEMEAGLMDPSGMSITKASFWVSVANLIFVGVMIVLYAGFIVLMISTNGFR